MHPKIPKFITFMVQSRMLITYAFILSSMVMLAVFLIYKNSQVVHSNQNKLKILSTLASNLTTVDSINMKLKYGEFNSEKQYQNLMLSFEKNQQHIEQLLTEFDHNQLLTTSMIEDTKNFLNSKEIFFKVVDIKNKLILLAPKIQLEYRNLIKTLLSSKANTNIILLVQRQPWLIDRMIQNLRLLFTDSGQQAKALLIQDIKLYQTILSGLINGNQELDIPKITNQSSVAHLNNISSALNDIDKKLLDIIDHKTYENISHSIVNIGNDVANLRSKTQLIEHNIMNSFYTSQSFVVLVVLLIVGMALVMSMLVVGLVLRNVHLLGFSYIAQSRTHDTSLLLTNGNQIVANSQSQIINTDLIQSESLSNNNKLKEYITYLKNYKQISENSINELVVCSQNINNQSISLDNNFVGLSDQCINLIKDFTQFEGAIKNDSDHPIFKEQELDTCVSLTKKMVEQIKADSLFQQQTTTSLEAVAHKTSDSYSLVGFLKEQNMLLKQNLEKLEIVMLNLAIKLTNVDNKIILDNAWRQLQTIIENSNNQLILCNSKLQVLQLYSHNLSKKIQTIYKRDKETAQNLTVLLEKLQTISNYVQNFKEIQGTHDKPFKIQDQNNKLDVLATHISAINKHVNHYKAINYQVVQSVEQLYTVITQLKNEQMQFNIDMQAIQVEESFHE